MPRPRLLVAEDEAGIAVLLQETLDETGFDVTVAPDGAAALECFEQGRFDVLLTDIRMPRMTGVDLVRAIRHAGSGIPVVVLSGYMTTADIADLRRLGVAPDAILAKPTSLPHVVQAVLAALQKPECLVELAG
jgi:two-component system response regulator AtoC